MRKHSRPVLTINKDCIFLLIIIMQNKAKVILILCKMDIMKGALKVLIIFRFFKLGIEYVVMYFFLCLVHVLQILFVCIKCLRKIS